MCMHWRIKIKKLYRVAKVFLGWENVRAAETLRRCRGWGGLVRVRVFGAMTMGEWRSHKAYLLRICYRDGLHGRAGKWTSGEAARRTGWEWSVSAVHGDEEDIALSNWRSLSSINRSLCVFDNRSQRLFVITLQEQWNVWWRKYSAFQM